MKKVILLSNLFLACFLSSAVAQKTGFAYFASGGKFGVDKFVKFYRHDVTKPGSVQIFDSLKGSYTGAAFVDQSKHLLLISAENTIAIYKNTNSTNGFKRLDTLRIPGVSSLKTYKNWLIAGKGYGSVNGNLSFFSLDSFKEFIPTVLPASSVSDMMVDGDSLFVAFGGGFSGPDSTFISTYYLGGKNPLFVKSTYIGSYEYGVSKIFRNLANNGFIAISSNYSKRPYLISATYSGKVDTTYFKSIQAASHIDATGKLFANINGSFSSIDLKNSNKENPVAKMGFAKLLWSKKNEFYISITSDFVNPDLVRKFDSDGKILDSFIVGSSTEVLAIDESEAVGIESENGINELSFRIFPNPVVNQLFVETLTSQRFILVDISGKIISTQFLNSGINSINTADLKTGTYFLIGSNQHIQFIKQ